MVIHIHRCVQTTLKSRPHIYVSIKHLYTLHGFVTELNRSTCHGFCCCKLGLTMKVIDRTKALTQHFL